MTEYTIKIEHTNWKRPKFISTDIDYARHVADAKRWKTSGGAQRWLNERPGYLACDYEFTARIQRVAVEYKGKTNKVKNINEI